MFYNCVIFFILNLQKIYTYTENFVGAFLAKQNSWLIQLKWKIKRLLLVRKTELE